ncbi:hypothetical protein GUJ93_ZPchr0013g34230 [Zizania palustris]|uniref:polyribonucleotide nucleotidyltransferase n=1 Tax=Zizania palustris TaxID=103762 RepID=A0A8J5WZ03_ZIZPA|nr:hypothetical protein GUJ93_ZPchr0013g34230 [Zizania palustris]
MFVLSQIEHNLPMPPHLLSRPILDAIKSELERLFLDKVVTNLGLCVSVYDIRSVEGGFIFPGEGCSTYKVSFRLLMFRPFVGEVLVGKISGYDEKGLHGTLAEKALLTVLPPESEFPYTVRVNSEVMASDDSTSMASVCGGRMALMDAGIPVREHVAGVSVGLVSEVDPTTGDISSYRILTDILGLEDHLGDMDFKIAGTRKGINAIQLDIKPAGIPLDIICENLEPAQKARNQILDCMDQEISSARAINDGSSPRLATLSFSSDSLRKLLFHKKGIERETGARVSVSDVGKTYKGTVSSIKEYGAFVEFNGGQHDLLHISELSHEPVSKVLDVVSVGQMLSLKCIGQDVRGNIKLSLKATLPHLPKKKDLASKDADCLPSQGVVGWMVVENMPSKNADVEPSIDTPACSTPSVIIRSAAGCDAQDGHTEKRSKVANSSLEKHSKMPQLQLVKDMCITVQMVTAKPASIVTSASNDATVPISWQVPWVKLVKDVTPQMFTSRPGSAAVKIDYRAAVAIPQNMPQLKLGKDITPHTATQKHATNLENAIQQKKRKANNATANSPVARHRLNTNDMPPSLLARSLESSIPRRFSKDVLMDNLRVHFWAGVSPPVLAQILRRDRLVMSLRLPLPSLRRLAFIVLSFRSLRASAPAVQSACTLPTL